jgi:hypothetical protein
MNLETPKSGAGSVVVPVLVTVKAAGAEGPMPIARGAKS